MTDITNSTQEPAKNKHCVYKRETRPAIEDLAETARSGLRQIEALANLIAGQGAIQLDPTLAEAVRLVRDLAQNQSNLLVELEGDALGTLPDAALT